MDGNLRFEMPLYPSMEGEVSPEEWETRVDLAACYRLVTANGWNPGIYNHISARVPGEPDYFLMKPHVLLWSEVTASSLVKVSMHEELDENAGVNRPGFVLHSGIMRARPDVNAAVHIHEEASIAVSMMKDGLLPLCQDAIFLYGRVGYHDYYGITENAEERELIAKAMADKPVLLMRSHGSVTMGASVGEAFRLTEHLVKGCQIQIDLMASGAELIVPSEETCKSTVAQHLSHRKGRGTADWPANLRRLDKIDPSYRS
jgi:ribulose-5-phosphate 4-epimerase/fuculose-1-phosphate aldolase